MQITGLAGLLSSQATREVTLSCGLVLTFSKMRIKDLTQRENEIVRKRGTVKEKLSEIVELLSTVKDSGVRDSLLKGLQEAVKELTVRPDFAFFDEDIDFNMSPYGKAYSLYLATREHTPEITEFKDARLLIEMTLTDEDRQAIEDALNWSSELQYLKNSDSPSLAEDGETLLNSQDGDS